MSIKLMSMAFDARVSNPLRKLVLLKLCDHANERGQCWPSFSYIADQCEISRRSAITHIQALINDGYLSSESRFKDGEQTTNMYTVSISRLIKNIAESAPPSAIPAPEVVQMAASGGASPAPRTTTEPSLLNINESKDAPQAAAGLFENPDDSKPDNKKPPKPKAAEKFNPESLADTMPPVLGEWWLKWIDYRRARKLSTKEPTWRLQASNLEEWGKAGLDPCQAIKASIENGWQGLFEPKPKNTGMSNGYQPRPANHIDDSNTDWINGIDPRVFDRARAGGTAAQQGSARSEGHMSGLEGCDNQPSGLRLDAPAVAHRDAGKQDFD